MTTEGGGRPLDWGALVPLLVHPTKVAIIESMARTDRPVSARELELALGCEIGLSLISYHLNSLAKAGVVTEVGQRPVRGALQHFFLLFDRL